MSQSPGDGSSSGSLSRYRQGWKALNRLLHEERSFSGNEKNCAFLNLRDGKFASVSSVTGLDFKDDSRAVAICDWDFDGKLDLWTSARTAPRIRLLRNQTRSAGHFVAVQLRGNGTTTNRDAIGARVEIITDNADEKSILTLHAGDGFLTQSSRWLHFGLGDTTTINAIRISWPGGTEQMYDGVKADSFHVIQQGSKDVVAWLPPAQRKPLTPQPQRVQDSTQIARIVPPNRLPLPRIESVDGTLALERPTLVCVWSATCPNCLRELDEWSKAADTFRDKGLDVVALNADLDETPEMVEQRKQRLKDMEFPFNALSATPETLRRIDYFQRALMDLWQPMPVPCAFLLDRLGRVVVIYKGPVKLEQIWKDMNLLEADFDQLRLAGLPFDGLWGGPAPKADPTRVSSQMIDHRQLNGAIDYLERFSDIGAQAASDISPVQRSDVQYVRSILLDSIGRKDESVLALESCRELNPDDHRVRTALAKHYLLRKDLASAELELTAAITIDPLDESSRRNLVAALVGLKKLEPAVQQMEILLQQNPKDATAYFNLGNLQRRLGNWEQAIKSYQLALDQRPNFIQAANNLAWISATHPDEKLRNGELSRRLAQDICEQTDFKQPTLLDTLAAAYAESGDYDKAVETIDQAIELLKDSPAPANAAIKNRREMYLNEQPFRDEP